jgi:hypothetical protein
MSSVLRFVVPIFAIMMPFLMSATAVAQPPPTQVITAVAVGPGGQPINGYQEAPSDGNVVTVDDCTTASPSAVVPNIYYCSPSAAAASTCWPSTPGSLLCVDNPWQQQLHRVGYSGPLPPVRPSTTPEPFALALDDGTHCLIRNGGAWGGRADGYEGAYFCEVQTGNLEVLVNPHQGGGSEIDRSNPVWTVKVGQLGSPDTQFPAPETRAVTAAWFAGT